MKTLLAVLIMTAAAVGQALPAEVVTALTPLYAAAAPTFVTAESEVEYSFVWNLQGHAGRIGSDHGAAENHQWIMKGYTDGIMHTHPRGKDSRPSPGDVALAKKAHISVWVLSVNALWVAQPDGKVKHFADVNWRDGLLAIN
jgi:opacity protein-like surface antigen